MTSAGAPSAIAAGEASAALYQCYGSAPPQPYLPADETVISPGQLPEFVIYDERTHESSSCMFVAIAKASDAGRTSEGWYANPVDRCNPTPQSYGSNYYSCTPTSNWYQEPGQYKWITYKFNQYCGSVGLCIDMNLERTIIVNGSDPTTPPTEPKPENKPKKKCKAKKKKRDSTLKKRKCKKKKKKKKKR